MNVTRAVASLEEAVGHQHLAGGYGWVGAKKVSPPAAGARGSRPQEFFCIFFNKKFCILMHSLAPKMGTTSVFLSRPLRIGEMKTVGRGCRMRPEGPKIEVVGRERGVGFLGREQQAPPARVWESAVSSPAGFGAEP